MFVCKLFILISIVSIISYAWAESIEERIQRIEAERTQYLKRMRALKPETTTYKDTVRALDDDLEFSSNELIFAYGIMCPVTHLRFGASCRKKTKHYYS